MYQCPSCGGNLQFDVKSQQLLCKYCNALVSPYSVEKETDGYEQEWYEATYFTCPQCGGEILTTDENTAAGFCSFCGASTILSSRISREKRPQAIIPFKVSKEECKKLYMKRMKKAIFAPGDIKDDKCIESFRGIYMPYWKYRMCHEGDMLFHGEKSHRSGDYIITDHYNLKVNVDADYDGFYYDSSSSFYDNISRPLEPFTIKESKIFTPSYLSGFYADTSDVEPDLYMEEAKEAANSATFNIISGKYSGYGINSTKNKKIMEKNYDAMCREVAGVMFPVWFMSYRKNGRVSYATVNGQTGKVVTDIPVDIRKYVAGALVLAVPLFFMLNVLFTFRPSILLYIVMALALITSIIYTFEVRSISIKEFNLDDKAIGSKDKGMRKKLRVLKNDKINSIVSAIVVIAMTVFLIAGISVFISKGFFSIALIAGCIISAAAGMKVHKAIPSTRGGFGFLSAIFASIICVVVLMVNPISDIYYYAAAFIAMIAVLVTITDILRNYNILSTRRLPQFNKQGGDDLA